MFCALSGEAPEVPVLSRLSGNVYEKRLLESYISEHGKDPSNEQEMSVDDIVEIKTSRIIKPRPPTATSIPSLLSTFQNEWDALALETYQLKQELHKTRQELSTSLYQHDAACRVIARITKERDEAREALAKVSENLNVSGTANGDAMEVDDGKKGVPQDIQKVVTNTMTELSAGRKKRKVPDDWTTKEGLEGLKQKKATAADTKFFNASRTNTDNKFIALHPSKEFSAVSDKTTSWSLNSGNNGEELARLSNPANITSLSIHPDGHLVALGSEDGTVYIFHLLTGQIEATFGPAIGPISSAAFCENGYWLAVSSATDKIVKVWHLGRDSIAAELEVPEGTQALAWDFSGQFLACVGSFGLKIWAYNKPTKEWSVAKEHEGHFTSLVWKDRAAGLVLHSEKGNITMTL